MAIETTQIQQVPPVQPSQICIPFDTNAMLFGSFTIGVIIARLGWLVNFLQNGLHFAKKVDPNLMNDARFQYAESILNTLDVILPGETAPIKDKAVVNYVANNPALVASLINNKSPTDITNRLVELSKTLAEDKIQLKDF